MKLLVVFTVLMLVACAIQGDYSNRYFNYSGNDGCRPANIGHGLGGDLENFKFNTLQGMNHIASMQNLPCFKNWELDINQTKDAVVLAHDAYINKIPLVSIESGDLPKHTVSLMKFVDQFRKIDVIKPVIIDIKNVPDEAFWPEIKQAAREIQKIHGVEVWFIISRNASIEHKGLCGFIDNEFDIMLYRRGGPLCN